MGRRRALVSALCLAAAWGLCSRPEAAETAQSLTFEEIWRRIVARNPGLWAAERAVDAAEDRSEQAGARPNPEIEWEAEGFGGEEERAGWSGAETTLRIAQTIEIGGKRGARAAVAAAEREAARADREEVRLDLWFRAVDAFVGVWGAEEHAALAEANARLLAAIHEAAGRRVAAGDVPPLDETRAKVERVLAETARNAAEREREASRRALAALFGEPDASLGRVEGDFEHPIDPADFALSLDGGARSPELLRLEREREGIAAALRREKASRFPDLTVAGGLRREEESGERSFVAGLSLPLPLFDRNSAAVRAAASDLARAESEREAAALDLEARLAHLLAGARNAHDEAAVLREIALPAAEEALEAARIGYEHGKLGYLDLVEAERSFVDLRARLTDGLVRYHITVAEIARAVGETSISACSIEPAASGDSGR